MANIKYYPEDELVQKVQSGEYGCSITSITTHLNGRKSTPNSVMKGTL